MFRFAEIGPLIFYLLSGIPLCALVMNNIIAGMYHIRRNFAVCNFAVFADNRFEAKI